MDASSHFQNIGWKEGRDPNAYFDVKGYLATNADVAAAGSTRSIFPYDGFKEIESSPWSIWASLSPPIRTSRAPTSIRCGTS